jgi:hypothetical protein
MWRLALHIHVQYTVPLWSGWLNFIPRIIFSQNPYWMEIIDQSTPFKYAQPFLLKIITKLKSLYIQGARGRMVPTQENFSAHGTLHSQQGGRRNVRIIRFSIIKFL